MQHLARVEGGLPQRVGAWFLLAGAVVGASALLVPGYVRPDGWQATLGVLSAAIALTALATVRGPLLNRPAIIAVMLVSDLGVLIGQTAVSRERIPVGFVLFGLPTMYCALFLSRRVFTLIQVPAAAAGLAITFWLWGDRGLYLALDSCIALAGVMGPAIALLVLRRRLETSVRMARDLADTDPLTGLANRRGLASRAGVVAAHAHREGVAVCLVIVDLDHFKRVNDARGHQAGDAVLQRVSASLKTHTRALDVVARVGGEEFVILAAMSADDGLALAERIREQIAADFTDVGMTASLGLSTVVPPADPADMESALWSMVDRADDFMYVAKELGRNRVVSARPPALTADPEPRGQAW